MQGKIATETRNARLYRISMSNKKAALRFFFLRTKRGYHFHNTSRTEPRPVQGFVLSSTETSPTFCHAGTEFGFDNLGEYSRRRRYNMCARVYQSIFAKKKERSSDGPIYTYTWGDGVGGTKIKSLAIAFTDLLSLIGPIRA